MISLLSLQKEAQQDFENRFKKFEEIIVHAVKSEMHRIENSVPNDEKCRSVYIFSSALIIGHEILDKIPDKLLQEFSTQSGFSISRRWDRFDTAYRYTVKMPSDIKVGTTAQLLYQEHKMKMNAILNNIVIPRNNAYIKKKYSHLFARLNDCVEKFATEGQHCFFFDKYKTDKLWAMVELEMNAGFKIQSADTEIVNELLYQFFEQHGIDKDRLEFEFGKSFNVQICLDVKL